MMRVCGAINVLKASRLRHRVCCGHLNRYLHTCTAPLCELAENAVRRWWQHSPRSERLPSGLLCAAAKSARHWRFRCHSGALNHYEQRVALRTHRIDRRPREDAYGAPKRERHRTCITAAQLSAAGRRTVPAASAI